MSMSTRKVKFKCEITNAGNIFWELKLKIHSLNFQFWVTDSVDSAQHICSIPHIQLEKLLSGNAFPT